MIKFNTTSELEHLLVNLKRKGTVFILPLEKFGRLGFPIIWDGEESSWIQLLRVGYEEDLFSKIENLPSNGYLLEGEILDFKGDEIWDNSKRRPYKISEVQLGSGNINPDPRAKKKPQNYELDKIIEQFSSDGVFKIDDLNIVKVIEASIELEADLYIGWFSDYPIPVCLSVVEV